MTNVVPIPPTHYLIFSVIIFTVSIVGIIINHRNLLILLISIELMLLAITTNFLTFSGILQDNVGSVFVFFILTVASAEAAIGLAMVLVLFRTHKTIDIQKLNKLKG